jgi:hypothetical protein
MAIIPRTHLFAKSAKGSRTGWTNLVPDVTMYAFPPGKSSSPPRSELAKAFDECERKGGTMALSDDLKDYIAKNSDTKTAIPDQHSVIIVGETHAPTEDTTGKSAVRTNSSTRLVQELLFDPKFRYYGSEYLDNAGPERRSVRQFLRDGTLPPKYDPSKDADIGAVEKKQRIFLNRQAPILENIREHPRYVLNIATDATGSARDARMAMHFFEEVKDRKLNHTVPGILLVGSFHAARTPYKSWPTMRMILEKHGYQCVSIQIMTDYTATDGVQDDRVVSVDTKLDDIKPADVIRLTSLVSETPITFPTDRKWDGKQSPFRKVTHGYQKSSIAEQYDYIVLEKA